MKGLIFTEFIEMVEAKFGLDTVDNIIESCDLPSGGSYTAVGTYDHQEISDLVTALSKLKEIPVPDLLKVYGEHLFSRFAVLYPQFFTSQKDNAFDFLADVQDYIHVEVKKLYPNAELPHFEISRRGAGTFTMIYRSTRHLEDLAEGLIQREIDVLKSKIPKSG